MKHKRFKKLTALILGIVMLLSTIPVTALGSAGGIEVKSIEYAGTQPVRLREGADKSVYCPDSNTVTVERNPYIMSQFEYNVTYIDYNEGGVEKTERMSGHELARRMEGYALISEGDHNSNNADWKAGDTYTVTVSTYDGAKCTVELEIIENPYQSLKYVGSGPITLVKGEDGFSYGGEWYYSPDNSGAIFEAALTDGTTIKGTLKEIERKTGAWFSSGCYYGTNSLEVGNTYLMWIGCEDVICTVNVTISDEGSFAGLAYDGTEPVQLPVGAGFVQEDGNIQYTLMIMDDPKYTVTLTETGMAKYGMTSNTFTGTWQEITDRFGISMEESSDQTTPWEIGGGPYYFTLTLGDASCEVPVVIADEDIPHGNYPKKNFESIELKNPDEVLELIEGIDDVGCYGGVFYYNPLHACNPEVTVKLTDEAKEYYGIDDDTMTMSWLEIYYNFNNAYADSSSPEDGWTLCDDGGYVCPVRIKNGTDNELTLNVPVKLIPETQIKSAQLIGTAVELVTGVDSYEDYDVVGEECNIYSLTEAIKDGRARFRVTLNNGSTIDGTGPEIYDQLGYYDRFPAEDEDVYDMQYDTPWNVGETGHSFIVYFGKNVTCTVPVTLSDPWVSNIELANCDYLTDIYGAYNDLFGADVQLKLTLTAAGKAKFEKSTMTGTVAELCEAMGGINFHYEEGSYSYAVGQEYEVTASMGGCTVTLPVKIVEGTKVALIAANFPDDNFRAYLEEAYGRDGYVIIEAVEFIDCRERNISSLKGIENFKKLQHLDCSGNQLTTLDVSANTALTELYCYENQLTKLDVSNNTALQYLNCDGNQLTALNVGNNTALLSLSCGNNRLTALNVSKNTVLESLYCSNNPLTTLDVSKNTALKELYCYNNNLAELDVSKNTALQLLECSKNPLTTLNVGENKELETLACLNNNLTELDVSSNTKLKYLYCSCNSLSSLDVSKCQELKELECVANTEPLKLNVANLENLNLTTVGTTNLTLTVKGDRVQGAAISGSVKFYAFNALELTLTNVSDKTVFATYAIGNESADGTGQYRFDAVPNGTYTLKAKSWYDNEAVPYTCTVTVVNGVVSGLPESFLLARRGDVTLDGIVDVYDLQRLYDHVNGLKTLTDYALTVADVNNDSNTTIVDVQRLYDMLIGNYGISSAKTG